MTTRKPTNRKWCSGAMPVLAVALTTCAVVRAHQAEAQDRVPARIELDLGETVSARGTLDAWESYPAGYTLGTGRRVARIRPGEKYQIVGWKTIPSLLWGDSYYIRIRPAVDPSHKCRVVACWAYYGGERHGAPWNFARVPEEIDDANGASAITDAPTDEAR